MALTPTRLVSAGITDTLVAVSSSESFAYPEGAFRVWLEMETSGTLSIATIESEAPVYDGVQELDKTVEPGATGRKKQPISEAYVDADGNVNITFSATTGVTAQVFYV